MDYEFRYKCLRCLSLHMVRCISHRGEMTKVQFLNTRQNGYYIIFLNQAEVAQGLEARKQFLSGWPWNYQVITHCIDFTLFLQFSNAISNCNRVFFKLISCLLKTSCFSTVPSTCHTWKFTQALAPGEADFMSLICHLKSQLPERLFWLKASVEFCIHLTHFLISSWQSHVGQTKSLRKTSCIINDVSLCPLCYLLYRGSMLNLSSVYYYIYWQAIIWIFINLLFPHLNLLFLLCKMQFLCLLLLPKDSLALHEFTKKSTMNCFILFPE